MNANFNGQVLALQVDTVGNSYISAGNLVFKVTKATGTVQKIAGGGSCDSLTCVATDAFFNKVVSLHLDTVANKLYTACESKSARSLDLSTNIITRVAGIATGTTTTPPDGSVAANVNLAVLKSIWVDANNVIYLAEQNKIRTVSTSGILSTFANMPNSIAAVNVPMPATSAPLNYPYCVWGDTANVYVCETFNFAIKKISLSTSKFLFSLRESTNT